MTDAPAHRQRWSRRRVLRAGGTGLATGLAVFGAGCTALPPLGAEIRYGTVAVPDPDGPAYRDWLPAPSALPDGSDAADGYSVVTVAPPPADAPAWARGSPPRAIITSRADYVGFHVDDADFGVTTENSLALLGDVDRAAVRDTLGRLPYEAAGTRAGYDVYERTDRDRVLGVGPDALVFGNGPTGRQAMAATIDAGRGDVPRYHETDENVAALTESAGMRQWAWLWTTGVGRTTPNSIREDTIGWATSFDYRHENAYTVETWVFPSDYDLTTGRIKRALKTEGFAHSMDATEVSAIDVSVEGRVATIAVHMGPDVVRDRLADGAGPVPFATWRSTHDADAEHLRISHLAGDAVRTDRLSVRAAELSVDAVDATDAGDRIEAGDTLTVSTADLDAGATVRLVYRDPSGSASSVLFTDELP